KMPGARGAGGCRRAGGGTRAAADHGGDAGIERLLDLLRTDEMNMAVAPPCGQDFAFPGDRLGAGTDDDVDSSLRIRIAGLADPGNAAIAEANVSLVDAGMIDDEGIGDHGIDGAIGAAKLALPHAIPDHLAAAELHLIAVAGQVFFDL